MGKFVIGILLLFMDFCLYCCIRVGSQEDDWMEEMERRRLEGDGADGKME